MQEISRGKKCLLSINIAKVGAVQNAVKIDTHIISPSGVVSCVANGYDELKKVVALIISGDVLNEVGAYSIDLRLVFADSVIIVPTFAFAEVVEGEVPCYGVSEVYVSIEGGEVVPSGSTIVEFVNREEFERLSKDVAGKVGKVEGKGLSTNDFTDEYKKKVEEFTIDKELSPTSDNAIANSAVVQGLAGLAEGVSEAIGNVAKNVEQNTADIKTKQETLTLETKPNGNIVIGNLAGQTEEFMPATPSGDPMHYQYLRAFPIDVNTPRGLQYNEATDRWSYMAQYGGITDLTTEEVATIFARSGSGMSEADNNSGKYYQYKMRTNFIAQPIVDSGWGYVSPTSHYLYLQSDIEVAVISPYGPNGSCTPKAAAGMFYECKKLRRVIGKLDLQYTTPTEMFKQCFLLEDIEIAGIKTNISFADSPLSVESAVYMISNADATAQFTMTFRADRQAIYEANADFMTAKSAKPNITILYQ